EVPERTRAYIADRHPEFARPRHLGETRGAPGPARRSGRARDMNMARALWEESARLTGLDADLV
ncbi:hypothetical protein I3W98_33230, partial [Streptomyces cavourensis]|nr:hypothetical protein [Streptomyces cavourensis]